MKSRVVNKQYLPMLGLTVLTAGMIGIGSASAAGNPPSSSSATKRASFEVRLDQAVASGKMTKAQEQAILTKRHRHLHHSHYGRMNRR